MSINLSVKRKNKPSDSEPVAINISSIEEILPGDIIDLPAMGSWPACAHVFDEESLLAIRAAGAARRPLLLRGEPGTGKSQLARAAAVITNRAFVYSVITARTEPQDLQWRYDALARLMQVQMCSVVIKPDEREHMLESMAEKKFIEPGPLWWALNPESARSQALQADKISSCKIHYQAVSHNEKNGCVLLIDEIDKADIDVPNSLLEVLGNNSFTAPVTGEAVKPEDATPAPLVIITTNEEREMPWAFIRRCLVHHLALPKEKEALIIWLKERGRAHFPSLEEEVFSKTAELIINERLQVNSTNDTPPGLAEFLDIIRAVSDITGKEQKIAMVEKMKQFVLNKKSPDSI